MEEAALDEYGRQVSELAVSVQQCEKHCFRGGYEVTDSKEKGFLDQGVGFERFLGISLELMWED